MDVISLGIGDPDTPTPDVVVDAMREHVARPDTHQYPSNRGRDLLLKRALYARATRRPR